MNKICSVLIATLLFAHCAALAELSETETIIAPELGTIANPVRSRGSQGAQEYIESLDCDNGAIPEYRHESTSDVGPHGNILDKYLMRCDGDTVVMFVIFVDPNHDETETEAVNGFSSWL